MTQRQKRLRYEANDYYAVLNLSANASAADVKKNFRLLALQWHPDKHPGEDRQKATNIFQQISEANEVLGTEDSRKEYDDVWQRVHASKPRQVPEFARNVGRSRSQGPAREAQSNEGSLAGRRGSSVEPRRPAEKDSFRPPSPSENDRMPRTAPPRAAKVSAVRMAKERRKAQQEAEQQAKQEADRQRNVRQQEAARAARMEADRQAERERQRREREERENMDFTDPHMNNMGKNGNTEWKNTSSWEEFSHSCKERANKQKEAERDAQREKWKEEARNAGGPPPFQFDKDRRPEESTQQKADREGRESWDAWCREQAAKQGWATDSWQDNLAHLGKYTDAANRALIAQRLLKGEKPPRNWTPGTSKAPAADGRKEAPKAVPKAEVPKAPQAEKSTDDRRSGAGPMMSFNPEARRSFKPKPSEPERPNEVKQSAAVAAAAASKAASSAAAAVSGGLTGGLKLFTKAISSPFTAIHRKEQVARTKNSRCPQCGWVCPVDGANYCGNCETRFPD